MGKRSNKGHELLDGMIMAVLRESVEPLQPLGINYIVNDKTKKLVGLNIVRQRLDVLATGKKIFKGEIMRDDKKFVVYWSKPM